MNQRRPFAGMAAVAMVWLAVSPMAWSHFIQADAEARALAPVSGPTTYAREFSDAYTRIGADSRCSPTVPRAIDVSLRWSVSREDVEAHRIDISKFRDGFETGNFLTSGIRPEDERGIAFEEAEPGIHYYWRVLSKTPAGWVVSGSGRFEAPICPYDEKP